MITLHDLQYYALAGLIWHPEFAVKTSMFVFVSNPDHTALFLAIRDFIDAGKSFDLATLFEAVRGRVNPLRLADMAILGSGGSSVWAASRLEDLERAVENLKPSGASYAA